jgi:hypothetical protein
MLDEGKVTMQQNDHVIQIPLGQESVSEPGPLKDMVPYRCGVLIFSREQKLLHANHRALELAGHLDQADIGTVCEIHSAPVRELRNAIQAAMYHRRSADIWEPLQLKRVLLEGRRKLLLRGIGLAHRNSPDDSRIVIVLEGLALQQERSEPQR